MAGTRDSISTKNSLVGTLYTNSAMSGSVGTAYNPTYALVNEAGAQIVLFINSADYKIYAQLKDKYGNLLYTSNIIDLPLEAVVMNGRYDATTKEVVLTLVNGNEIRFSVEDLVRGLVDEDQLEEVLGGYWSKEDLTEEDIEKWNNKQDYLNQGENIQIYSDLNLKGQIQQVSTTGKNIIDLTQLFQRNSGATTSNILANSVTINGTGGWGNTYFYIPNTSKNTDYTASCKAMSSLARKSGITIAGTNDTSGTGITTINSVQGDISADVSKKYVNSFNSGDYEYIVLRLWNNATATALGSNVELNISEIQLELGSTPTDYEPYTGNAPSPSPSYPQPIHIVSGDNEIKVCNKNLFDINTKSGYSNNGSLVSIENNTMNVKILGSGGTNFFRTFNYKGNKTYTIQGNFSINYGRFYIRLRKLDDSGWMTNSDTSITGWGYNQYYNGWYVELLSNPTKTITIPNCLYWQIGFGFQSVNVGSIQTISNIQIEEGSTATDYVEHQGYTKEINLGVKNLFDKNNANVLDAYLTGYQIVGYATNHLIYIPVKSGETFTISKKIGNSKLAIAYTTSTPTIGGSTLGVTNTGVSVYTTTVPNTATYLCVFVYGSTDSTFTLEEILSGIEIVYGDKPQEVSDNPIEVGGIGDYEDEFFKNTIDSEYYDNTLEKDKWYLKKRIGKYVYNDDLATNSSTSTSYNFVTPVLNIATNLSQTQLGNRSYCNMLPTAGTDTGLKGTTSTSKIRVNISKDIVSSFSEGMALFASKNLTIYYPYETPTNILLNDTLQEQLNGLSANLSNKEMINIIQENNDLPFKINYDNTKLTIDVPCAGADQGGVIKTSNSYATATADGVLTSQTKTYAQYNSLDNNAFVSKGTLKNVLDKYIGDIDTALDAINGEVI